MIKYKTIGIVFFVIVAFCSLMGKKPIGKHKTTPIKFVIPANWPTPHYDFSRNPLTLEGVALGRKLFYDGILSKDGTVSCVSCHQQAAAFGTFDHDLSHGFNNQHSLRNAPPLQNLAWQREFHADGGINNLDLQPLAPITAPNEMGETLENVINKLNNSKEYPALFLAAFGDAKKISTRRITQAISQFLLTLVSCNSKYDRVKNGLDSFSLSQKLGEEIFIQKCAGCHPPPLFSNFMYKNIGLAMEPVLADSGRMRITRHAEDSLKFKVPSLRNIMITYPYGHDGRVYDIFAMLNHYKSGVIKGPTTDSLVKNGIPLSNFEKGQLVAFLTTLTDTTFLKNKAFANP